MSRQLVILLAARAAAPAGAQLRQYPELGLEAANRLAGRAIGAVPELDQPSP